MKLRLFSLAALLGAASFSLLGAPAAMPKTGLAGTTHDIGLVGCKSCHAPHNGSVANGGSEATGLIQLWSRSFPESANTFGVYDSATMANKAVEVGGDAPATSADNRMYSLLCLSCHDGVTSSFTPAMRSLSIVASKASSGVAAVESFSPTNDHPVNVPYDPAKNPSLQAVATLADTLPLYGSTNSMQCSTCHDPHNNSNTNYLRQVNNTAHCTTCHV